MKSKKLIFAVAAMAVVPATLLGVGCSHKHSYGKTFKSNDTHHWYQCSCGEKKDSAEHVKADTYSSNDTHHWKECTVCGHDMGLEAHAFTQQNTEDAYLSQELADKIVFYKSCACGAKGTETFDVAKTAGQISSLTMSSVEIVYGDNYDIYYQTNSNGAQVIEYKAQNADDSTYTQTKPTNAGTYTARVSVAGTKVYSPAIETIDFEIKSKTIDIQELPQTVVYNGTLSHTIDLGNIEQGLTLEVTFAAKDVGSTPTSMIVESCGNETNNFEVPEAYTVDIAQRVVTLTWEPFDGYFDFDGTEKTVTASISSFYLCEDDECDVTVIKTSGDNFWFGEEFVYEATGLSNPNYKLPDVASITCHIDRKTSYQVGRNLPCSLSLDEKEYRPVELEGGKYYYFTFEDDVQGTVFEFEIYSRQNKELIAKRTMTWTDAVTCKMDESVFYVETSGDYYLVITGKEDVNNEGTMKLNLCAHDSVDEYGFCTRCGEYGGQTVLVSSEVSTDSTASKTYFRFAQVDGDIEYAILHDGSLPQSYIKIYRVSQEASETQELELEAANVTDLVLQEDLNYGNPPTNAFVATMDGYYYVVIDGPINTTVKIVPVQQSEF